VAKVGAGPVRTPRFVALIRTEVYSYNRDPLSKFSILSIKPLFIDSEILLIVIDILASWALVVSSYSLVSVS
jgi:hypothetical protein